MKEDCAVFSLVLCLMLCKLNPHILQTNDILQHRLAWLPSKDQAKSKENGKLKDNQWSCWKKVSGDHDGLWLDSHDISEIKAKMAQ